MSVRRLTTDDADAYRRVRLAALADAPGAFGSTFEGESTMAGPDWVRRLANEDRAVFVAEEGGEIVGLAVGAPDDEEPGAGYLLSMWVDGRARGRGHGDALVQSVLGWLQAGGYRLARLHVTEGNEPAAELYRRNGFALSGKHFHRERDGAVELEMTVTLEESPAAG